jgi:GGDEF domain-containing protein
MVVYAKTIDPFGNPADRQMPSVCGSFREAIKQLFDKNLPSQKLHRVLTILDVVDTIAVHNIRYFQNKMYVQYDRAYFKGEEDTRGVFYNSQSMDWREIHDGDPIAETVANMKNEDSSEYVFGLKTIDGVEKRFYKVIIGDQLVNIAFHEGFIKAIGGFEVPELQAFIDLLRVGLINTHLKEINSDHDDDHSNVAEMIHDIALSGIIEKDVHETVTARSEQQFMQTLDSYLRKFHKYFGFTKIVLKPSRDLLPLFEKQYKIVFTDHDRQAVAFDWEHLQDGYHCNLVLSNEPDDTQEEIFTSQKRFTAQLLLSREKSSAIDFTLFSRYCCKVFTASFQLDPFIKAFKNNIRGLYQSYSDMIIDEKKDKHHAACRKIQALGKVDRLNLEALFQKPKQDIPLYYEDVSPADIVVAQYKQGRWVDYDSKPVDVRKLKKYPLVDRRISLFMPAQSSYYLGEAKEWFKEYVDNLKGSFWNMFDNDFHILNAASLKSTIAIVFESWEKFPAKYRPYLCMDLRHLDINDFKLYNSIFTYKRADALISIFVDLLFSFCLKPYRIHGDEFCALHLTYAEETPPEIVEELRRKGYLSLSEVEQGLQSIVDKVEAMHLVAGLEKSGKPEEVGYSPLTYLDTQDTPTKIFTISPEKFLGQFMQLDTGISKTFSRGKKDKSASPVVNYLDRIIGVEDNSLLMTILKAQEIVQKNSALDRAAKMQLIIAELAQEIPETLPLKFGFKTKRMLLKYRVSRDDEPFKIQAENIIERLKEEDD